MPFLLALILSIVVVFFTRAYAFRGTNGAALLLDIIIVIVLTCLLSGC